MLLAGCPGVVKASAPELGGQNASICATIGLGEAVLQALAVDKLI